MKNTIIALFTFVALTATAQQQATSDSLLALGGNSLEKTGTASEAEFTQAMTDLQRSVKFDCGSKGDSAGDCTMFAWTCKGRSRFNIGFNAGLGNQAAQAGNGGVVIVNDARGNDMQKYAGFSIGFSHEWGGGGNIQLPLPTYKLVQTYMALASRPGIVAEELKKKNPDVSATYNLVMQLYGTVIARANVSCNERN